MKGYVAVMTVAAIFISGVVIAQEQVKPQMGGGMQGKQAQGMCQQMGSGCGMMQQGGMGSCAGKRIGGSGNEGRCMQLLNNAELLKEIGVSDDKVTEVKAKLITMTKDQIELDAKLKIAELEKGELMKAEKPDEKAIMTAIEKSGELQVAMAKLQAGRMIAVKNAITPDQMKKAREIITKKMQANKPQGQMPVTRPNIQRGMNRQGQTGQPNAGGNAPQVPVPQPAQ